MSFWSSRAAGVANPGALTIGDTRLEWSDAGVQVTSSGAALGDDVLAPLQLSRSVRAGEKRWWQWRAPDVAMLHITLRARRGEFQPLKLSAAVPSEHRNAVAELILQEGDGAEVGWTEANNLLTTLAHLELPLAEGSVALAREGSADGRFEVSDDAFSDGRAMVAVGSRFGFVDIDGWLVIPPRFDEVRRFKRGRAAVQQEGKWGFVDRWGQVVAPLIYDRVWDYGRKTARVERDGEVTTLRHDGSPVPFDPKAQEAKRQTMVTALAALALVGMGAVTFFISSAEGPPVQTRPRPPVPAPAPATQEPYEPSQTPAILSRRFPDDIANSARLSMTRSVEGPQVSDDQVDKFIQKIGQDTKTRRLGFIKVGLTAEQWARVSQVERIERFRKLAIRDSTVGDTSLISIARSLPDLEYLEVSRSELSAVGVTTLTGADLALKVLNLSGNPLGPEGATALAGGQQHFLEILFLDDTDLGDEGVEALVDGPIPLWELSLAGNGLTDRSAVALGKLDGVHILDLSRNNLTSAGMLELLPTQLFTSLRHLNLSHNQLDEEALVALAQSPHVHGLQSLAIGNPDEDLPTSNNACGQEAVAAISRSWKLSNLRTLEMPNCNLSQRSLELLKDSTSLSSKLIIVVAGHELTPAVRKLFESSRRTIRADRPDLRNGTESNTF